MEDPDWQEIIRAHNPEGNFMAGRAIEPDDNDQEDLSTAISEPGASDSDSLVELPSQPRGAYLESEFEEDSEGGSEGSSFPSTAERNKKQHVFKSSSSQLQEHHSAANEVDSCGVGPSNFTRRDSHILPEDSSPNGKGLQDDIEAQHERQPQSWYSKVRYALRENQKKEKYNWGFCILKVPDCFRQPPAEFTPEAWRFGLHNRENQDISGSDALKLSTAVALGLVGEKWDKFCNAVVTDSKSTILQCYGLQEEEPTSSWKEIQYVLALDALFLAVLVDGILPSWVGELTLPLKKAFASDPVFFARFKGWHDVVSADICKVENQIPFDLIRRAISYFSNETGENDLYFKIWMKFAAAKLGCGPFRSVGENLLQEYRLDQFLGYHILQVTYNALCGKKSDHISNDSNNCNSSNRFQWFPWFNSGSNDSDNSNDFIHVPSATKLTASGIKIKGIPEPLSEMSYKNCCLSLPKIEMHDETAAFLRNMAWYEYSINGWMLTEYILLMIDLIQSPADVKRLTENNVLQHGIPDTIFKQWKALDKDITMLSPSKKHHDMKKAITKRCKARRYRYWNEFLDEFCSKPWKALATITAVVITVATLIQTYESMKDANRMLPQFPLIYFD